MKEIEKKDLPEVGGGAWSEDGCVTTIPDPLAPPRNPLGTEPDPTAPLQLDR